jgi:hypothetical protein
MMNDSVFIEAAQSLARKIATSDAKSNSDKVAFALKSVLVRPVKPEETKRLAEFFEKTLEHYKNDEKAAEEMATKPLGPVPDGMKAEELAAWTVVSNVILNLDEFLMRL